jgi:hypothetical protein
MADEETKKTGEGEQVVTPWEAKAGEGQSKIDYDKLISMPNSNCLQYNLLLFYALNFFPQSSLGVCGLVKAS